MNAGHSKRLLRTLLMSWVLTVPIVVTGSFIAYKSVDRFLTFQVRYDPNPAGLRLSQVIIYEYERIIKRVMSDFYIFLNKKSNLRIIEIYVKEKDLASLNSHLPQSGFEYVKALIKIGSKLEKAKLKYRGDYLPHWGFDKKSLRIKTSKEKLFEGMRAFNLQAPKFTEQLNNYFGYRLASDLGLLAPKTELVGVVLNGENLGVHVLVEQLEETTLRNNGLMPGDIYRGEIVGKDRFVDVEKGNLFQTASKWDKMAVNNHYDINHMAPLKRLLELLKDRDSLDSQAALSNLLDMKAWGRFSAFEAIAQTRHFGASHNWRIYYDPWKQKLVPIVWDAIPWVFLGSYKKQLVAPEVILHELHNALFLNGDFIRSRNKAINSFYESGKSEAFLKFVRDSIEIMRNEIKLDPLLWPPNPDKVIRGMSVLQKNIIRSLGELHNLTTPGGSTAMFNVLGNILLLEINGKESANCIRLIMKSGLKVAPTATINYKMGSTNHSIKTSPRLSGKNGEIIKIDGGFLSNLVQVESQFKLSKEVIKSGPGYYEIVFEEFDLEKELKEVEVDFGHGFGLATELTSMTLKSFTNLHFPAKNTAPNSAEVWSGEKIVSGYQIIEAPVIIKPGTRILLEKDAVLVFSNQLHALGTQRSPIIFESKSEDQEPWGTIVIMGENANGSQMSFCEVSNGSGHKAELREYSGMLSIHAVKDITISDCIFKDNHIVDDMIHVVYSEIKLERCELKSSVADGIDIDMSDAILENCLFQNCGNDGVDLMGSTVRIIGSRILNNGDKGISVGEGTHLIAIQNSIDGNLIGVESKDSSIAVLFNCKFSNNKLALNAYKKNWQYDDGGHIYISKSMLVDNSKGATADKNSSIYLYDCFANNINSKRRVKFDRVDSRERDAAATEELMPKQLLSLWSVKEIIEQLSPEELSRIQKSERGVCLDENEGQ